MAADGRVIQSRQGESHWSLKLEYTVFGTLGEDVDGRSGSEPGVSSAV